MRFSFRILLFSIPFFFIAFSAKALCPVCTFAVAGGVGLSRWLGVDDLIAGIWIGGLTVSVIFWTLDWLAKRQIDYNFKFFSVWAGYYLLILGSLHFPGILWHPANKFLGTDKIIFGITVGTLIFLASVWFNDFLKNKNRGKVYFPYQKVAVPVLTLIIISLTFYFLILWR